jgi:hypothetical protein
LKHEANLTAPDLAHPTPVGWQFGQVNRLASLIPDHFTANDTARAFDDPQDGARRDALAAAAFADNPEGSPGQDVEAGAVDGSGDPFVGKEVGLEVTDAQHRVHANYTP